MTTSFRFTRRSGAPVEKLEAMPPRPLNLLSVKESAGYAKVSTQTIRREIKAGRLKTYRAGKQIRIDEADLVKYLSQ